MSAAEQEYWEEAEWRRGTDNAKIMLDLPLVPLRSLVKPRRKAGMEVPTSLLGARRLALEFDATIRARDDLGVPSGANLLRMFLAEHGFATDPEFPDVPVLTIDDVIPPLPTDEELAAARDRIGGA